MEQRLGLSELTQFWCETTVIGGGGGEKRIFEGCEFGSVHLPVKSFKCQFEERGLT